MHTGIVIILPEHNRGRWQVNVTDGVEVWARRQFTDARKALTYVYLLMASGERVIFPSALRDLKADAQPAVAA